MDNGQRTPLHPRDRPDVPDRRVTVPAALRGRPVGYWPNAPARVFSVRCKDLRRPSLARRAGMRSTGTDQVQAVVNPRSWDGPAPATVAAFSPILRHGLVRSCPTCRAYTGAGRGPDRPERDGRRPVPPSRVAGGAWRVEGPQPAGGSTAPNGMDGDPSRPAGPDRGARGSGPAGRPRPGRTVAGEACGSDGRRTAGKTPAARETSCVPVSIRYGANNN